MADVNCLTCGAVIYLDETTYANYQGPVVCSECRGRQEVMIQEQQLVTASLIADVYEPIRDILAWEITEDVLLDLAEASVALGANIYKSTVVMCRRCVQSVLLDGEVEDNPNMKAMIDEAVVKKLLTEELGETANSVRFFGVTGAHPKDPALRKVTKLQASLAIEITKEILKHVCPEKPVTPLRPDSNAS